MNNRINRLHGKCLRIVYSDKTSPFEELLDKDGSVTIHTRNLKVLATDMFKVHKNLSATIAAEIFLAHENSCNQRHSSFFFLTLRRNCLSRVCEFIQLRTENVELSFTYIE